MSEAFAYDGQEAPKGPEVSDAGNDILSDFCLRHRRPGAKIGELAETFPLIPALQIAYRQAAEELSRNDDIYERRRSRDLLFMSEALGYENFRKELYANILEVLIQYRKNLGMLIRESFKPSLEAHLVVDPNSYPNLGSAELGIQIADKKIDEQIAKLIFRKLDKRYKQPILYNPDP